MSEDTKDDFSELRAFISGSLKAIIEGIADVQKEAQLTSPFGSGTHAFNVPKEVSFDIAVSAERTVSARGGFSLKILSVGASTEAAGDRANSTVTRLQFAVPTGFKSKHADQPVSIPTMSRSVV
ncbi:hypothetical protein M8312_04610 [Sphingomonas sp. KRR8]|uniref:hypothetical protein n=1 Tax=Sphingomonas sp. KRR8 TaxID=2942996 RepID=UPI002020F2C5|nr:hypothetical protein [Sphingomonas sp. KRR8]URD61800.1 hypothetical protein M8312_04610 [Sphingomonas sp. KRR8]